MSASPPLLPAWTAQLATGLALARRADWSLQAANAAFERWFPGEAGATLAARVPNLDLAAAEARLAAGRSLQVEVTARAPRPLPLGLELRSLEDGLVLLEARDETRRRQAEYMLDSYSRAAERQARELERERARSERLLLNVMPRGVLREMRDIGTVTPHRFERAAVLLLDFVGFTEMALRREPTELVAELNDIFGAFDRIGELCECERIKTNGDCYMAVSGAPEPAADPAGNVARAALRMRRYLRKRNAGNAQQWPCRIGLATGPLVGSLVGGQRYVYDIFGPAVNLAARLEALCEPYQVLLPDDMAQMLQGDFALEPRGRFDLKGIGSTALHALLDQVTMAG